MMVTVTGVTNLPDVVISLLAGRLLLSLPDFFVLVFVQFAWLIFLGGGRGVVFVLFLFGWLFFVDHFYLDVCFFLSLSVSLDL